MSGSGGDEFLLKWNDHHNSFFNIMQELCANEVLTDVTLACGGRVFETHKIMLCVCSAFFRQVLTRQTDKHPIVFLKDIRPKHLEQLLQYMYNGEINVLQEDLAPLIDAARALQIKGLADTPSSNSQAPPAPPGMAGPGGLNGKQPKLPLQLPTVPSPAAQPPPMKRARPPSGAGGLHLMNHHNRRKAESPKQILQHPHAAAMAAALPNSFLPTQPLPPAAAMSPLALQQLHQQQQEDDEDEEEEEISEEAPVDHRQIKEDHIEIYGSDDAGDPDGSGGGSATGDYEISQEMYQDDDMQDDGSQTPPAAIGGGRGGVAASAARAAAAVAAAMAAKAQFDGGPPMTKEEARNRYRCEECGKGFITPSKLQRHSFSHSGLRPFNCEICAKSFSQAANLKTHIRNTHPEVADTLAPPRRSASTTAATPAAATDDDEFAAASAAYTAAASAAAALLPPKSEAADH